MGLPKGKTQLNLVLDTDDANALRALSHLHGQTVSETLRGWITTATVHQTVRLQVEASEGATEGSGGSAIDDRTIQTILKRLNDIERVVPKFNEEDLLAMKDEVLDGNFGSMRYRLGIVESQMQRMGGSIAWEKQIQGK